MGFGRAMENDFSPEGLVCEQLYSRIPGIIHACLNVIQGLGAPNSTIGEE